MTVVRARSVFIRSFFFALFAVSVAACQRQAPAVPAAPTAVDAAPPGKPVRPVIAWDGRGALEQGATYVLEAAGHVRKAIT